MEWDARDLVEIVAGALVVSLGVRWNWVLEFPSKIGCYCPR